MIGGYIYSKLDMTIEGRLQKEIGSMFEKIQVWDNGYLFHDNPFGNGQTFSLISEDLFVLSQDLLVTTDASGEYRLLDLTTEFRETFSQKGKEAFNVIDSDFRMIVAYRENIEKYLLLLSNRAGSGRIYFHKLKSGVFFCSDLRFLLRIV